MLDNVTFLIKIKKNKYHKIDNSYCSEKERKTIRSTRQTVVTCQREKGKQFITQVRELLLG